MSAITIEVPDIIVDLHQHNMGRIKEGIQQGLVIWEYVNGTLSLRECGQILHIGYRGFLELLWSKGIPIDGLSPAELDQQTTALQTLLEQP
jgi:hypothetical protein